MAPNDEKFQGLKDAKIMIVDDEPTNIEVVQTFLEAEKYHNFVTLNDATQGLRRVEEERPDLLLLDLIMPEVSGFDILAGVRAHPKLKHLPVIILTAATDSQSKLKALDLGATDFLAKPLDQSELGLRVRNTLAAKAFQDQLIYYDGLTKLPNRQLFIEDLTRIIKTAKRYKEQLALLSIEIDNFDKVKDTLGHGGGDELLRLVAHRIQKLIKRVEGLSRFEGDNKPKMALYHLDHNGFCLLIQRLPAADHAAVIANQANKTLRSPMRVAGGDIYVTVSIGIAAVPPENDNPSEMLRLAIRAKDYAKQKGGNCFQISSTAINAIYKKRVTLKYNLRNALEKKEFVLYYQPIVELNKGTVKGVEALLRWKSPNGLMSPDQFIPLAEETGLIVPIGEWVLSEACQQLNKWHQSIRQPISMAVNFSANQFAEPNFLSMIKQIISSTGVNPSYLSLELTESVLRTNIEEKIKLMQSLRAMGLKLSLGDFGTGYSSLSILGRLPLDELKIDRALIGRVTKTLSDRAIVAAIVYLAKSLKLSCVAVGIETEEALKFLQKIGCRQYQGFIFSRPVPNVEIDELLSNADPGQIEGPAGSGAGSNSPSAAEAS